MVFKEKQIATWLILLILLVGCTPQQRLNRLLTKHSYLAKTIDSTIFDTTRVITKDVKVDTVTSLSGMRTDTFVINKENLWIKTIVHKDSIYVYGNCQSDTIEIIKKIKVPVKVFEYTDPKKKKWWRVVLNNAWMLLFVVLAIWGLPKVWRIVKKYVPWI